MDRFYSHFGVLRWCVIATVTTTQMSKASGEVQLVDVA